MRRLASVLLSLTLLSVSLTAVLQLIAEDDLGDVTKLVKETVAWRKGLNIALWDQEVMTIGYHDFVEEWQTLLNMFDLNPGCNIVDIGANLGDSTLNLAVASEGGTVVAFEMGPPIDMLRYNVRLNPQYDIHVYHLAVSDTFQTVHYESVPIPGCNGCNGGIANNNSRSSNTNTNNTKSYTNTSNGYSVPSVRLVPFLKDRYSQDFIDNICLVKIDTEGHDEVILADLPPSFRPPMLWVEWYGWMKLTVTRDERLIMEHDHFCTESSANYFHTISELGYEIFEPTLPLRRIKGCANRFYKDDLLLIEKKFLVNFIKSYPKIRNFIENVEFLGQPYEINVFNDTNTDYYLVRK